MTTVTVAEMDGALREFPSLDSKCPLHILIASRSAHPDCLLIASGLFLHPFPRAHTRARRRCPRGQLDTDRARVCACLPETAVHVDVDSDTSQVAWSEERKLLEYHRGRGVFYPLIQVRAQGNDLPGSVPAEGGDDHERGHFSTSVAVAGSLFFFFYELGLQGRPEAKFRNQKSVESS